MKKVISVLLISLLLISCFSVFASAGNKDDGDIMINNINVKGGEGMTAIYTPAWGATIVDGENANVCDFKWWDVYVFESVGNGGYKLISVEPIDSTAGKTTAIPANGFVFAANTGNDYPALYESDPVTYAWCQGQLDYYTEGVVSAMANAKNLVVGESIVWLENIDLENLTLSAEDNSIPYYSDDYVSTSWLRVGAQEPVSEPEDESDEDSADASVEASDDASEGGTTNTGDTSVVYLAVVAVMALLATAVVVKKRA